MVLCISALEAALLCESMLWKEQKAPEMQEWQLRVFSFCFVFFCAILSAEICFPTDVWSLNLPQACELSDLGHVWHRWTFHQATSCLLWLGLHHRPQHIFPVSVYVYIPTSRIPRMRLFCGKVASQRCDTLKGTDGLVFKKSRYVPREQNAARKIFKSVSYWQITNPSAHQKKKVHF